MEVFVEVVRKNGFARAADALDTSPANVTRIIADLESHLGTRLLNRSSRKMSLTESGDALYERAKTIVEDMAEVEAIASSTSMTPRGLLRMNAPLSFGVLQLAPLWRSSCAASRRRTGGGVERPGGRYRRGGLRPGDPHLALRPGSHAARKLATSQNICCAAPAYLKNMACRRCRPTCAAQLHRLQLRGHRRRMALQQSNGQADAVKVNCPMHTNNGDTARAVAVAGGGVIWQPTFLSAPT